MNTCRLRLTFAVPIALAIALTVTPRAAMAHAFPAAESPGVGSVVYSPPAQVIITYDAPVESAFARLAVLDTSGANHAAGRPFVAPDHLTLGIKVGHLAPGDYTVKWSVVAEDGHRTEGSYTFTVAPVP